MKALSVRNPWAHLIARGDKTIELRTRRIHYRGELLICSSLNRNRPKMLASGLRDDEVLWGHALCVAQLVDVRPAFESDARAACTPPSDSEFAWILERVRRVAPFPVLGRLSLFDVEDARIVIV
jgi:hypothetical protein